jgi:hypothetical protein
MYFLQIPEAEEYQFFSRPNPADENRITGPEMRPILDASVQATATFDFHITPEVNLEPGDGLVKMESSIAPMPVELQV